MSEKARSTQEPQPSGSGGGSKPRGGRSWFERNRRDLRFLFIFATCMGLYYLSTLTFLVRDRFFPAYLRLNASLSGSILVAMGQDVSVAGNTISTTSTGAGAIKIERGCDAIEPSALFLAAVLASPVAFRAKLLAGLWGVSALLLVNLVRIVSLFLIKVYYPSLFQTMHLDVWQVVFILAAILLWGLWASRMSRRLSATQDVST